MWENKRIYNDINNLVSDWLLNQICNNCSFCTSDKKIILDKLFSINFSQHMCLIEIRFQFGNILSFYAFHKKILFR